MSEKNHGAGLAAGENDTTVVPASSAPHDVPTIAQMRTNYDKFCAAVDKEAITLATIYAAVCADHIEKLLKVLESGDYALISKRDRISAIRATRLATRHYDHDRFKEHDHYTDKALALLQLIGSADPPLSEASGSVPSAAQKDNNQS